MRAIVLPRIASIKDKPLPEMAYYEHLWDEKEIKSVVNVTRADAEEFFPIVPTG